VKGTYRFLLFITVTFCLLLSFTLSVMGSENDKLPTGLSSVEGALSNEARDELPDGFFSEDPQKAGEAVSEVTDIRYTFDLVARFLRDEGLAFAILLMKLCGLLMIASIVGALQRSISSEALAGAVRFCSVSVIFATVIHMQIDHLRAVGLFFERLSAVMTAMIPITGAVWAMGGNISTASSGTAAMYVFLSVCEGICAKSVIPVCCVFTVLALCNTLSPEMGLRGFSGALKKIYTFFLGMVMTLLMASLTAQTTLTSAADSTAARAARLVSSNVIPVVGGSVGDALRTVAASVQYLKSIVGIGGIVIVALLLLPTLLSLIMTRLAFLLGSGIADILGCDMEGKLLSELGGVYAIMIAVVSMSSVMFIFALTIFSKTMVAIA